MDEFIVDWTLSDIRNELLRTKKESRVPTYREPHLLYNVKTNPTLENIEKFINIVGEEGYNIKLKDVEFKDIEKYLQELKDKYNADGANIVTCTVEVEDDGYFDFEESIKDTFYKWDGKTITKTEEKYYG